MSHYVFLILLATPLIPAVNSPSLGDRTQAVIVVPSTALNGIISFALESLQVYYTNAIINTFS